MKRKPTIYTISAILLISILYFSFRPKQGTQVELLTEVRKGTFEDMVVSSGELLAKNSEEIKGPQNLRQNGIYQLKIQDLVPEGTYVKEGDYVATLDRTEISSKITESQIELDKIQSQYTQTKLDTALTLRQARDDIKNLEYTAEQSKLTLEQSKYEPPATIKQAELNLEKTKRDLQQEKENYIIKKAQSVAKMKEVGATLQQQRNKLQKLIDIQSEFIITAPKEGMLTYFREWGGTKRQVGSEISPWDPTVATLPDLSLMLSKTYINEVEIRKIKEGQEVAISLDAFPEAKLSGKVVDVANVGEKRKSSDAKVFEVVIEVGESDSTYRPGMTTSNKIITSTVEEALLVPLEAIFNEGKITFVYLKKGSSISKQQVKLGKKNQNEAVVEKGVDEGSKVFLSAPKSAEDKAIVYLEGEEPSEEIAESQAQ